MSAINTTFDAMRAAMEAYERLPEAEREIERLKRELEQKDMAINHAQDQIIHLTTDKEGLSDKLRSVEVERDQYGFWNLELAERLEKVAALLPALAGAVERESEVKPMGEPVGEVTQSPPASTPSASSGEPATAEQPAQSLPALGEREQGEQGFTAEAKGDASQPNASPSNVASSPEDQRAMGESANSGYGSGSQSPPAQPQNAEPQGDAKAGEAISPPRPHAGKAQSEKPWAMTWGEWMDGGGDAPNYVSRWDR